MADCMRENTTLSAGQVATQTMPVSKGSLWAGCIMSTLPALFLLLDGVMKLVKPEPVVQATVQLKYPECRTGQARCRLWALPNDYLVESIVQAQIVAPPQKGPGAIEAS
jgi:hypothetical protein